ncbi:MAG: class I SAM-dependent DNA methyltransferase, partial [Neisseriaceae bacterium]|nr:class I SAM-dependent DNA methyltransferase [Neisseriaceae bacterium]
NPKSIESLNKLCVRLVFCLYAEDTDIFHAKDAFRDYLLNHSPQSMRQALIDLFTVLNTPQNLRQNLYLSDDCLQFPYANGGLFTGDIEIPLMNDEIYRLITTTACEFDWSEISPTIFGAVFESTLNPETRRSGGMHYTSIENIHKVIDPLFLDDLKDELAQILQLKQKATIMKRVAEFQHKLASLTFLDPAAGSGNFLTETYISLRRIENQALAFAYGGQKQLIDPIKVSISQFYGIEINDFAVSVAQTALWIAEIQSKHQTEEIFSDSQIEYLPLKTHATFVEGNALRLDWNSVIPASELNYIMGNPPFVGARIMNAEQKADLFSVFDGVKNNGNLDYVACWYKKAAEYMQANRHIRTALVSTNSITQGEQVAVLWQPLFDLGVEIDFAYRTFRWDSESNDKAKVHCVIIGFSLSGSLKDNRNAVGWASQPTIAPTGANQQNDLRQTTPNGVAVGKDAHPTMQTEPPTVIASERSERGNLLLRGIQIPCEGHINWRLPRFRLA